MGIYMNVVFLGIYNGAEDTDGNVGSAVESVQDVCRDSLEFNGIGGNKRKVSLSTARTVMNGLRT